MKIAAVPLLLMAALCAACAAKDGGYSAQPQATPALLIQSRGVPVTLAAAVRKADFAPFVPPAQIVSVALLPPLSDEESKRRYVGIGMEYENDGDALLLSQWPRAGFHIAVGSADVTSRPCAPVAYKPDGLLWTTRDGRVMTLQPDGTVLPSRIGREAARLLRAGACGRRTRSFFRPLPSRPTPSVSSPRRSAF
ncbi:MAG TPA: hypothetical protein VIO32_05315 [Candidatus Baltobacteraceae bacterium]